MTSKVIKPIIVFGTGRSGTTIFHQMLSEHPNVAWLSGFCNRYPDKPILNRLLMKLLEYPFIEKILRKKFRPREGYEFWEYYCKGFRAPCRDLLASDVTIKVKKNILDAMSKLMTEKRNRLLIKITGWPRIGFFSEIVPDAKFIHVIRDGRAVANSLINVKFWRGWGGPEKWRWGPLPKVYQEEWNNYNKSFIVLAAIQWKILMDAAEEAKKHLKKSSILEVKYEELCADPIGVFLKVAEFCEIEWNSYFENRLKQYKLKNANNKYKQELTPSQQKDLETVLNSHLKKYGYL